MSTDHQARDVISRDNAGMILADREIVIGLVSREIDCAEHDADAFLEPPIGFR